ncbi:hypothetical protein [Nonomuraea zeae]|uniref:Uncharacterized protein n=1 Tax=Nonomuraea zeae TaxID=1642303 RepID=A0A5S4G1D6_9ACTN|nr:hypothetical protein [Nonomuraea zeae]TMR26662.1 hypothetical protein ETD85_41855 [Nonomuraea zeae]
MNTQIRRGRLAALAMTGAVASVMFLPLGLGVAYASAGFSTVQAGGPPEQVHHVTKPRYVPREKPILRNPHWRPPNIDVFVHNRNDSHNKKRFDRHHEVVRPNPVKPTPVKPEPVKPEPIEPDKHDDGDWWWPEDVS